MSLLLFSSKAINITLGQENVILQVQTGIIPRKKVAVTKLKLVFLLNRKFTSRLKKQNKNR